ncbi:hypothetical protein [Schleiferilactobacillus harbinensis]|uniref:hypothetical protein n=1 Tax=Schleiferilactobacillus harbinensis TaxID=304207 RepID=UPI001D053650|nr:hypothetical protein [Schleiferilactobacillus harbinensis]
MRLDVEHCVHQHLMNKIKPNFAEIARRFDTDPRTVKRYYEQSLNPAAKPPEKLKRPSKLDPFKGLIREKVEAGCSASAIYHFIKEHDYRGGQSILRDYCRTIRQRETKRQQCVSRPPQDYLRKLTGRRTSSSLPAAAKW